MELAPLLQDLVTGDVHQVMELHLWSASRVRRNSEIRMVQVRQMRREVAQLLDGNQNKTTRIRHRSSGRTPLAHGSTGTPSTSSSYQSSTMTTTTTATRGIRARCCWGWKWSSWAEEKQPEVE
nr:uncharacterized protein LOC127306086 isoform X2 [Lolium perenne]